MLTSSYKFEMNDNQNINSRYEDDEIDLKELIITVWKRRNIIIALTLIFSILAGLFSMFILMPVYDTRLNIIINMPKTYKTRYGEYTLPITTNAQYLNLFTSNDVLLNTIRDMGYKDGKVAIENLKGKISVETTKNTDDNSFNITVSEKSPEESLKLAETLYSNYIEFLDVMTKERAISFYYNYFTVNIKSLEFDLMSVKEILAKNEALLAHTPQTINQKEALEEINSTDFVVLENIINTNYTKLENDIITNKQSINSIENSIRMYNEYLKEIEIERKAIAKYYQTGRAEKLDTSIIGVVETSVYLPSPPVAPTEKTSPSNTMNVLIGGVLGGMFALMVVFIKDYWWIKKN